MHELYFSQFFLESKKCVPIVHRLTGMTLTEISYDSLLDMKLKFWPPCLKEVIQIGVNLT